MMDCSQVASEMNRLIATTFCLEKDASCCICLQAMYTKPVIYLPCTHFLHTHCLKETVKSGLYTCPLCRRDHTTAYMKVHLVNEEILKQKEARRQEAQRLADENYVLTLLMGDVESQQMLYLLMQPGLHGQILSQLQVFWQEVTDEEREEDYDEFAVAGESSGDDAPEPLTIEEAIYYDNDDDRENTLLMEDWM